MISSKVVFENYIQDLSVILGGINLDPINDLAEELLSCWQTGRNIFICGNGGSAANAEHIANDMTYPISKIMGSGLKIYALSSNSAIMTCLANDEGYENVYSYQLAVQAEKDDVLIVLSGSGNSPNVVNALKVARTKQLKTFGIFGFDGGACLELVDTAIHCKINDMQISEDMQTIIFHMIMKWLYEHRTLGESRP